MTFPSPRRAPRHRETAPLIRPRPGLWFRRAILAACVVASVHSAASGPDAAQAQSAPPPPIPLRRVNVPNLEGTPFAPAILWLGNVTMTSNYADVRVWHYNGSLRVILHITDRLLWHDSAPSRSNLTSWDAASLYIDLGGNMGHTPGRSSHWFVKQLGNSASPNSRAVYRGDGTGWIPDTTAFTADDAWRGNYPNDLVHDVGWQVEFNIPFSSLGLTGPPDPGTVWGLAIVVHDRDDAAGAPIPDQVWPESLDRLRPETWGQMRFGRTAYTPPHSVVTDTAVVRQGLNGAIVRDAAVGGHTVCGEGMNAWTQWGNANYAGYSQFNIQNQWDVADFMCFSKYYVTFPLVAVPAGKTIISARVVLSLFGNAGYTPSDATPSAIHALTVVDDWQENTITWNNAPRAAENLSVTWVSPVDATHPAGPYSWDVSAAVADAYAKGLPLRLAFYSTAGDYHSGKYFWTSDVDDWNAPARPTLEVQWGPSPPRTPTGLVVR